MLAGLLPMFFGLGLILIYVLTREDDKGKRPSPPPARLGLDSAPDDDPAQRPQ
jgi:hypothetical protein